MKKKHIFFILVSLCFLVYANSLNNAFVSDDIPGILKNPLLSSPLRFWLYPSSLLHSLNYLMAGYNPFLYHLTNITLHSLNTILVFFFLHLFFKTEASVLGASLFAVHPIHTEAVTWVSGRPYLIIALFIFTTYFLYQRATEKTTLLKVPLYCLSLLFFSYFIITHFTFYSFFPFLLILLDLTLKRWRKNWKWWIPFLGILTLRLISARSLVAMRISGVAKDISGGSVTWSNPFFNMVYSLFSHLSLLFWPAKLTLYHEPAVISLFALKAGIVFLLILILALPLIFKKAKEIFFALMLFILFLAPTYSPVMISWLVAERYLYFPSVALSITLAFFYERFGKISSNSKRFFQYLFIFIIAGYAVRTVARNEDWKSPERFWRQTLLVSYNSPRAHNNMGDIYSQEGNVNGAIAEFKKAIELKADYADAYHNLANTYHRKRDLPKAIQYYQQAISFNPELFESHFNLGIIYLNRAEWELAIKHLKTALKIRPDDVNAQRAFEAADEKLKK